MKDAVLSDITLLEIVNANILAQLRITDAELLKSAEDLAVKVRHIRDEI